MISNDILKNNNKMAILIILTYIAILFIYVMSYRRDCN